MRQTLDFTNLSALIAKPSRFPSQGVGRLIGVIASLVLLALAAIVIGRALARLQFADLAAAIGQTHGAAILSALCLTGLSYIALIGYDVAALRQTGARAPAGAVALASFASNAFAFTLGFPWLTGAAVRYWVYARAALTAGQVANITVVVSLTFWLGMAAVLGLGLTFAAEPLAAIDRLPPLANFCLGAVMLGLLAYYCFWVSLARRGLRLWGHVLELPQARIALTQLALGVVDIGCAAAALHVLLPPEVQNIDFTAFAAIYVFAALVGAISHAPGGVGVFEAVMLGAVPSASPEILLAALLLFR
ncbi:MAG: lysylphosphatidylglycerol synthase domain-containing protein, partial [Methylocystis sp.]